MKTLTLQEKSYLLGHMAGKGFINFTGSIFDMLLLEKRNRKIVAHRKGGKK